MKLYIAILLIFFTFQTHASNICYGHDGVCTNVVGCDQASGCLGTINEILRVNPTMYLVWQNMIGYFGGNWTVVQTRDANWYTNARIAVICDCNKVRNIFVQQ